MTAVHPLPRPEAEPTAAEAAAASAGGDAEGWALLDGLRRRLDDQGAQQRKTAAQVSQLAESIGALVETHRRQIKRVNLNSFVAYLIFTVLCGAGCFLLYSARARELIAARDHAVAERDAVVGKAAASAAAATAREQADTAAWEVYELLVTGKRADATAKLSALHDLALSRTERAAIADRAQQSQVAEADAALKTGAAAVRAGKFSDAITPLQLALAAEPPGPRAALMHYYLGVALSHGSDVGGAVTQLQAAVTADVEQDDARFQLANALDRSGAWAKARAEYDRFSTAHPQSQLAVLAMRRSATLARMPAQAPPPPIPGHPVAPVVLVPAAPVAPHPSPAATGPASGDTPPPVSAAPPIDVPAAGSGE